jgi:hypothetical protein
MRFQDPRDQRVQAIGKRLLNHYVSTGILIEKQIEAEKSGSIIKGQLTPSPKFMITKAKLMRIDPQNLNLGVKR